MNIHIPRWLIFTAVAAFALFEVVTHAPTLLNAYSAYKAQQAENAAKPALVAAQTATAQAEATMRTTNPDVDVPGGRVEAARARIRARQGEQSNPEGRE